MLKIRTDILESINDAAHASDLFRYLQGAIALEHALIPAYLQALYSIKYGTNGTAAALIRSIVVEEMLHMTIAANVLNAIGGEPLINDRNFVLDYPSPLPMSVHGGLAIGLAPLSKGLLQYVFMEVEIPEDLSKHSADDGGYVTIGQFYRAIIDKLRLLDKSGDDVIVGDPARQVVDETWFPREQLFEIRDVADAVRSIEIILRQGEGTDKNPTKTGGQPPHYYRFAEIFYGRRLLPDSTAARKYSFSGAPVPFDPAGIWDLEIDPKVENYAAGGTARAYAERFNRVYTNLLISLHQTFNGQPRHLRRAIGAMYELRLAASALIEIRLPGSGKQAAPSFQYTV
jgi:hypothetical protein